MIPVPIWTPTNATYHAEPRWSSSKLKTFRASPAEAHGRYVARTLPAPDTSTAMVVGSIVNALLLEPERAVSYIYVCGAKTRTAKEYRDSVRDRPHQLVVTADEWEEGDGVAGALLAGRTEAARVARRLLTGGDGFSEYAHKWDDATGVPCKTMVDRLRMVGGWPAVVELKTTEDPDPARFKDHFIKMGYDAQAAFNSRGLTELLGAAPRYYVVAARSRAPYEVAFQQIPVETLARGAEIVEADLRKLAACLAGGPWESPWETLIDGEIPFLPLPGWAQSRAGAGNF